MHCAICEDERQYVGWDGQRWTALAQLQVNHEADIRQEEASLHGIGMKPSFAIGQRALLVQTPAGNVLWDCISLLNDEIYSFIESRGGLSAIAISHPHFYGSMVEWADAFDAPIYLHRADQRWVMRGGNRVVLWDEDVLELEPGITLLRLGGHFPGGTVLHWAAGQRGRGALLSGDIVTVVPDRRFVSFMRSYPNLIPLPASEVRRIAAALERYQFDRIYGGWFGRVLVTDGKAAVRRSAERYVRALDGDFRPAD